MDDLCQQPRHISIDVVYADLLLNEVRRLEILGKDFLFLHGILPIFVGNIVLFWFDRWKSMYGAILGDWDLLKISVLELPIDRIHKLVHLVFSEPTFLHFIRVLRIIVILARDSDPDWFLPAVGPFIDTLQDVFELEATLRVVHGGSIFIRYIDFVDYFESEQKS